jgi:hypothetical protein
MELQWLTEKHYLVCPKGVMFKQMKVMSQRHVSFSGFKAATAADTMVGNPFMCMGALALAAPPVSKLQSAALGLLAFPLAGMPRIGIAPQILLIANTQGMVKCTASSASRKWINTSPNLVINRQQGVVVGKSMLLCPSEGVAVMAVETFWKAMMSSHRNKVGHIASFAFGLLAGRGLGTMSAAMPAANGPASHDPGSLFGTMNRLSRNVNGTSVLLPPGTAQETEFDQQEKKGNDKLMASGQELTIAIISAKGASLTCFPAGTLVHTSNGLRPIEEIHTGTMLWTMNESNGQRELKPVKESHRRTTLSMVIAELEDGTLFEITPDHRVMSSGSWKEIQELKPMDELEDITGTALPLKHIGIINKSAVVYNFSVWDNENYFVTEAGLLVHNASYL